MSNPFESRFASVAVPSFIDHFGERDGENLASVELMLTADRRPFKCNEVMIGRLTERYLEIGGQIVSREACVIQIPTEQLRTENMPLTDNAQVKFARYGSTPFHVLPDECEYGGPFTKLSLVRHPQRTLGNFHEARSQ